MPQALHQPAPLSPAELLASSGSLTALLRLACQQLSVQRLAEGPLHGHALTALADGGPLWQRLVCLYGDGQPWLLAATLAPQSQTALCAALAALGDAPLGDWLFGEAAAQRLLLEPCPQPCPLPLPAGVQGCHWGRRSLFTTHFGGPLLISEWLLDGYPSGGNPNTKHHHDQP